MRTWLKVEEGVHLSLEERQGAEEEHGRLAAEEDARFGEEARLKAEEEEQARLRADGESHLAK